VRSEIVHDDQVASLTQGRATARQTPERGGRCGSAENRRRGLLFRCNSATKGLVFQAHKERRLWASSLSASARGRFTMSRRSCSVTCSVLWLSPEHAAARRRLACAVLSPSSVMSPVSSLAREWQSHGGPRASSAGCAPTAFGVASPYTVSIARLRIALEALNPRRITACRHDGPDNIVANPRVRLMVAGISRASAR
jgi:hypothetical protein